MTRLVGRTNQLAVLQAMVAEADLRPATGGALLITGEPGIGKSALLNESVANHSGRTVQCRGATEEFDRPFAALHQAIWEHRASFQQMDPRAAGILDELLVKGTIGDRAAVAPATLALLEHLTDDGIPLLIAVDDAHLVDPDTARVLRFVARRLRSEPVVMIAAGDHATMTRTPFEEWDRMHLGPLSPDVIESLVRTRRADRPTDAGVRRIIVESGGNPLIAITMPIPNALSTTVEPVDIGEPARTRMLSTVADRPSRAMTIAAAHTPVDPDLLHRAVALAGIDEREVDGLVETGILQTVRNVVSFASPALRSAVYWRSVQQQRRAHAVWSEIWRRAGREPLVLWHEVVAGGERDHDRVNRLLELAQGADLAADGGARAEILETVGWRANAALPDEAVLSAAAREHWARGNSDRARDLVMLTHSSLSPSDVVDQEGVEGLSEFVYGHSGHASDVLRYDLTTVSFPSEVSLRLAAMSLHADWASGRVDLDEDRPIDALIEGYGYGPRLTAALVALVHDWRHGGPGDGGPGDGTYQANDVAWQFPPAAYAVAWGAGELLYPQYRRAADRSRAAGAEAPQAIALAQLATIDTFAGRWSRAESLIDLGLDLAERQRITKVEAQYLNLRARIAAYRGDFDSAVQLSERSLVLSAERSAALTSSSHWNLGLIHLLAGDATAAHRVLSGLRKQGHSSHHPTYAIHAAADAAEAAIRIGDDAEADAQSAILASWERRTGAGAAVSANARTRALQSDDGSAETLFVRALTAVTPDQGLERARTQLHFGEWLRRHRRRRDAQPHLADAGVAFARLGAAPLLQRADASLELVNARPLRIHPSGADQRLTAQEQRVAELAASGMTNGQIGASLFISPRTVGHHLSAAFRKLGIEGRHQLHRPEP